MTYSVPIIQPLPDTYAAVKKDLKIDPEKIAKRKRLTHEQFMRRHASKLMKQKKKPHQKSLNGK